MYAVTIRDGELVWQEHEDPTPGFGELLVAVEAAGVNAADLMQRQGLYPAPPGVPADIPGMELAGTVVGVGPGTHRYAEGDRVFAIVGGGAQAELCRVPEGSALPVPETLSPEEAGGFPEVFITAHDALFTQAGVLAGERVLVSGAAGGVGTAGVQLASAAGAHVVASVRNRDHHAAVAELGAAEVVVPDEVTEHGPYDVSLELVGADGVSAALRCLAPNGRIVVIGVSGSGAKLELNLLALMGARATLRGSTLRARSLAEKAAVAKAAEDQVLPLLAAGTVKVLVADSFALPDAAAAYERFKSGSKLGKVVLVNR
ncbi:MAG: zinc-binding dehydrogenase [Acidimicrobiales bacterium]|nr:zinc-binding dehydrogenase [Acidimicrobiales bacterium]